MSRRVERSAVNACSSSANTVTVVATNSRRYRKNSLGRSCPSSTIHVNWFRLDATMIQRREYRVPIVNKRCCVWRYGFHLCVVASAYELVHGMRSDLILRQLSDEVTKHPVVGDENHRRVRHRPAFGHGEPRVLSCRNQVVPLRTATQQTAPHRLRAAAHHARSPRRSVAAHHPPTGRRSRRGRRKRA